MTSKYVPLGLIVLFGLIALIVFSGNVGHASPPPVFNLPDIPADGEHYIVDPPLRVGDLLTLWGNPVRAIYNEGYTSFAWDRKRIIVFGVARPDTPVDMVAFVANAEEGYPCIKETQSMSPYGPICIYVAWKGFKIGG